MESNDQDIFKYGNTLDLIKSNVYENRMVNDDIRSTLYNIQSKQELHHAKMLRHMESQTEALVLQAKIQESMHRYVQMIMILVAVISGSVWYFIG